MNTNLIRLFLAALAGVLLATPAQAAPPTPLAGRTSNVTATAAVGAGVPAGAGTASASPAIPFSDIGAKATADYKGDAIGIAATAEGARLHTAFQKLSGTVTREGLWLGSTAEAGGGLRLVASGIGRGRESGVRNLAPTGTVSVTEKLVTFSRPGLTEEYSVSVDGVRQDFIVGERPAGAGDLRVELAITGARAEAAAEGARLTLEGSGRVLAYSRLRVTDATGKELTARLEVLSADRLAVRVEDAAAAYPVRIDPTFSDANWVSLNPGIPGANSYVFAAVADGSGNLYIGGSFTLVGTVAANNIAKWNGSAWSALGTGMNSTVNALAVSGTDLYAGGDFTTAGGVSANRIAKWNGSAWSPLGTGVDGYVGALAVSGTDLYAGGDFTTAGGVAANRIAKWNGSAWSPLGTGVDSYVWALAVSGTDLYAGGYFTFAGTTTLSPFIVKASNSPPTLTVAAASSVAGTTATLNGTVNPNGLVTTAQFEYGLTTSYGSTASVTLSPNNGSSAQGVSAAIAGLSPGTPYHYRLTATNSVDTTNTSDATFTTAFNPQAWRLKWFGTTSNTGTAADAADPYGTGVQNLAVFAVLGPNQDPAMVAAGLLPQPQFVGANYVITFTQPTGVSGVTYGAEWRADLASGNWTTITDTGTAPTHTFSVPTAGNPQVFLRLRITSP